MAQAITGNRAFVLEVHRRLCKVYGEQIKYFHDLDPLSELVSALLSHRTKNSESGKAFKNLISTFGSWEAVRDADTKAVEEAIAPCTWPEQKAPRIQQVLRLISEARNELSLEFLRHLEPATARAWLEALPGVGPKTSAAVLQFSNLRAKALAVDSHHFRVAVRLCIIDEKIGEARANRVLEALVPEQFYGTGDVRSSSGVHAPRPAYLCALQALLLRVRTVGLMPNRAGTCRRIQSMNHSCNAFY